MGNLLTQMAKTTGDITEAADHSDSGAEEERKKEKLEA